MSSNNGKLTGTQLAVTTAAIEGDSSAIYHLARDLLSGGMPFNAVLFDVLAPVQAAIGHRWQYGDYLISEEHAATAAIETVVALLAWSFEQPAEGVHVVVTAVQGDTHSLPARMIAADLVYRGFKTTLLGATMPASDLQQFLVETTPDAVVLTCAMSMHLPGAAASIEACHRAGVPVLVGGHAYGPGGAWAGRLGADGWVPALRDVADKLDSWALTKPTISGSGTVSSDLAEFAQSRPLYVTGAASALASRSGGAGVRFYEELEMLFDVLVASMVVGDDEVIIEFVGWLAALVDSRGGDPHDVASIVAALKAAVAPGSPHAAERLARAASAVAGG